MFIQFDIVEFYPSISEEILNEVLDFFKKEIDIEKKEIDVIKAATKTFYIMKRFPGLKDPVARLT